MTTYTKEILTEGIARATKGVLLVLLGGVAISLFIALVCHCGGDELHHEPGAAKFKTEAEAEVTKSVELFDTERVTGAHWRPPQ